MRTKYVATRRLTAAHTNSHEDWGPTAKLHLHTITPDDAITSFAEHQMRCDESTMLFEAYLNPTQRLVKIDAVHVNPTFTTRLSCKII